MDVGHRSAGEGHPNLCEANLTLRQSGSQITLVGFRLPRDGTRDYSRDPTFP